MVCYLAYHLLKFAFEINSSVHCEHNFPRDTVAPVLTTSMSDQYNNSWWNFGTVRLQS